MRELSLFSGAGFGVLGTKLLGFTCIGYVEINDYCQQVIAQRIADGIFDSAPVFGDVRDFILSGAAEEYEGFTEVVTAGFPCQPFSVAGKNKGATDDRNLWPEVLAVIRAVRPRYALLENVPNLLAHEYIRTIFGELAEIGYDCRWDCISAAACGAPHRRDRLWIVAESQHPDTYDSGSYRTQKHQHREVESQNEQERDAGQVRAVLSEQRPGDALQDAQRIRRPNQASEERRVPAGSLGNAGARSDQRLSGNSQEVAGRHAMADASCIRVEGNRANGVKESSLPPGQEISGRDSARGRTTYWKTEPSVGRLVDGCTNRVQRLRALGNGQVPQVVATAWRLLSE